jgi:hypothetical protein
VPLPGAISSVPDGLAAAVLTGVNPVQGLVDLGGLPGRRGVARPARPARPAGRSSEAMSPVECGLAEILVSGG